MKKVIKLNEQDLENLVRKIIKEDNGDWSEDKRKENDRNREEWMNKNLRNDKEEEYRSDDPAQLDIFADPEEGNELVKEAGNIHNEFIGDLELIVDEMEEAAYGKYWDEIEYMLEQLEDLHEGLEETNPNHPGLVEIQSYIDNMNGIDTFISIDIKKIVSDSFLRQYGLLPDTDHQ